MKATDFQNALTNVNDKYIEEAAAYRRQKRSLRVWKGIAIAACCVIALSASIGIAAAVISSRGAKSADNSIVISETGASPNYSGYAAGGGYGGYALDGEMSEAAGPMAPEMAPEYEEGKNSYEVPSEGEAASNAKIIYTADIGMESTEFDKCLEDINALVDQFGGYYENKNIADNAGKYRTAIFSIRIPKEQYESFIRSLAGSGTITYQYQSADDVSESYYDIQSRLETAKTKLKRLQELMATAEEMADIITIEEAISETEWEIDYYQGQLNSYDSKVTYSTISINLKEVYEVVDVSPAPLTFGERISKAFNQGLKDFGEAMENLAVFFAEGWTWILFIIVIHVVVFLIIFFIVRGAIRKRRRNR